MAQPNEISKYEGPQSTEVARHSEAVTIMQVIERAAANPSFDPDKMDRLLQMQERILDRQSKAAYTSALADMQPELPKIAERGKGNNEKAYALWEDINERVRPILAKHGFALTFRTGIADGKPTVTAVLTHREGHAEETTMVLPSDTSGSKNPVQAVGSSTSYGKRYTALALLNITTGGEDDDGRAAGIGPLVSEEQIGEIVALIESVGASRDKILRVAGVERIADIPAAEYPKIMDALNQRARR